LLKIPKPLKILPAITAFISKMLSSSSHIIPSPKSFRCSVFGIPNIIFAISKF